MTPGLSWPFSSQSAHTLKPKGRALAMAQAIAGRIVQREALTLAFDDVFRLMAYLFLGALVLVPFCKPPPRPGATPRDVH